MKLYNANFSPNCLRVHAVIFELLADVEIVEVDVFGGGTKTGTTSRSTRTAKCQRSSTGI